MDTMSVLYEDEENVGSRLVDDDKERANILSKYFAQVYIDECNEDIPSLPSRTEEKMDRMNIDENEIANILQNLDVKKAICPEGFHPLMLKVTSEEIAIPLKIIFETSIKQGKLPQQWKNAIIKPIYKKGDKKKVSNYRPVSITSQICRTLEKIIRRHIMNFMCEKMLLSKYQYGFIKGRSTSSQLLNIMKEWVECFEKDLTIDCIYFDYKKAFDKVPHKRLINKIKAYNFDEKIVKWIEDYLAKRKQRVIVNNGKSEEIKMKSGIPQGSVLGPLLFLIYINDITDEITSNIYLYADDTKLYRTIQGPEDIKTLQKDINKLEKWSTKWKLEFHPGKCTHITFAPGNIIDQHKYTLTVNQIEHTIESKDETKDIGILVDNKLTFEDHIKTKIKQANKILGIIRRNIRYLTPEIFIPLYKSLIRSQFDYGVIIWNPWKLKIIDEIESVQRRATKLVNGFKNLSYEERLYKLKLPTMTYRRARGDMIELYKIIKEMYDPETMNKLLKFRPETQYRLRGHKYKLEKVRVENETCRKFFHNRVVNLWNSLPEYIVDAENLGKFKSGIDKLWSNQRILTHYRATFDFNKYVIKPESEICMSEQSEHLLEDSEPAR